MPLHPHDPRHRRRAGCERGTAHLDIDYMPAAEHALRQIGHAARQRDPPAIEQRHPIAHALHLVEMVRRQQDCGAVRLEAADHPEKFLGRVRIQGRCRLVEDRDARALHQDFGEPQPLTHAAREGRDPVAADIGQPDPDQRFGKPLVDLTPRQAGETAGIGEVVARRQPIVKADRIGQIADPPLDFERLAQRVEAGDLGAPLGRLGEPEQHQDRRGFARPVRPQYADDLAGADLEVDMVDRHRARRIAWSALRP